MSSITDMPLREAAAAINGEMGMPYTYTHKDYCGHWTDADLARTAKFKRDGVADLRRDLARREEEARWIAEEQQARLAAAAAQTESLT
jgi:hypothetical protein